MAFSITDWNVNENREWFIRLYDNGSNIGIRLFHTQSDAESQFGKEYFDTASKGWKSGIKQSEFVCDII